MSETIWVAIIAAVPPTLAAFAALWQARRLARPIAEVNAAVNHRSNGQRRLVEVVDDIHAELRDVRADVAEVRVELAHHRAWHVDQLDEDDEGVDL